jgi:hypothetical protein
MNHWCVLIVEPDGRMDYVRHYAEKGAGEICRYSKRVATRTRDQLRDALGDDAQSVNAVLVPKSPRKRAAKEGR